MSIAALDDEPLHVSGAERWSRGALTAVELIRIYSESAGGSAFPA